MKKITSIFFLLFLFSFTVTAQKEQLPIAAQKFLTDYYPSAKIKHLKVARLDVDKKYKVKFRNRTKMIFDQNGNIREIKGKYDIRKEVFPEKIKAYLLKNHADKPAVEWEIDPDEDNVQEVTLKNGTVLEFDRNGDFLKEE